MDDNLLLLNIATLYHLEIDEETVSSSVAEALGCKSQT